MRHRNPFFYVLILGITLLPLLLTSCMSSYLERDKVVIEKMVKTYLEHRVTEDKIVEKGYAHPYSFATEELAMLMKSMRYQEPKFFSEPESIPVFQPAEADRLAGAIAQAMGTANSTQRVRFVSYSMAGWGILNAQRKTEGVCFLEEGGMLHFAFITINDKQDPREAGQPDPYLSYVNPLKIRSAQCPLIPTEWSEIHQDTEDPTKKNPLWLVIDLEAARKWFKDQGQPVYQPVEGDGKPVPPTTIPEEDTQPKENPQEKTVKEEIAAPEEEPDTLKRDLKKLKQYFDEGLITEEEYKAKKAELLEKL